MSATASEASCPMGIIPLSSAASLRVSTSTSSFPMRAFKLSARAPDLSPLSNFISVCMWPTLVLNSRMPISCSSTLGATSVSCSTKAAIRGASSLSLLMDTTSPPITSSFCSKSVTFWTQSLTSSGRSPGGRTTAAVGRLSALPAGKSMTWEENSFRPTRSLKSSWFCSSASTFLCNSVTISCASAFIWFAAVIWPCISLSFPS
mmetsp:Transcript_74057/g.176340  ORF Transcript_74057/g.176340 Transcript_74057/m.176340 type:complete len:204 (-) Transcript_74057:1081-1692(-)